MKGIILALALSYLLSLYNVEAKIDHRNATPVDPTVVSRYCKNIRCEALVAPYKPIGDVSTKELLVMAILALSEQSDKAIMEADRLKKERERKEGEFIIMLEVVTAYARSIADSTWQGLEAETSELDKIQLAVNIDIQHEVVENLARVSLPPKAGLQGTPVYDAIESMIILAQLNMAVAKDILQFVLPKTMSMKSAGESLIGPSLADSLLFLATFMQHNNCK